jgi:anthranilate synthase/aminodeoxychorismate synthase-like glutamine amidotransferase
MILLIDNYDSFVYNLDRYLQQLGHATLVVRSDAISVEGIRRLKPDAIVISPGPKSPDEAGCSMEVVRLLSADTPILGVCLGHQAIGQAFGGRIVRADQPMHGKSCWIRHTGSRILEGLPNPLEVGRYHSLVIEPQSLPSELIATAWSEEGHIMVVEHASLKVYGVQFHPESILTPNGYEILSRFLKLAGLHVDRIPQNDIMYPLRYDTQRLVP